MDPSISQTLNASLYLAFDTFLFEMQNITAILYILLFIPDQ